MILSLAMWPALLAIPFLPLTIRQRTVVGTAAIVVIEVLFWGGALLAGKEAANRYKDKLNPSRWLRMRRDPDVSDSPDSSDSEEK